MHDWQQGASVYMAGQALYWMLPGSSTVTRHDGKRAKSHSLVEGDDQRDVGLEGIAGGDQLAVWF